MFINTDRKLMLFPQLKMVRKKATLSLDCLDSSRESLDSTNFICSCSCRIYSPLPFGVGFTTVVPDIELQQAQLLQIWSVYDRKHELLLFIHQFLLYLWQQKIFTTHMLALIFLLVKQLGFLFLSIGKKKIYYTHNRSILFVSKHCIIPCSLKIPVFFCFF